MCTQNATLLKLFCLDGLFLDRMDIREDIIDVFVRSPRTHARCPHCETTTTRVHRNAQRTVKHMQCDGKLVQLQITMRNFLCQSCKHIFREAIAGIDRRHTTQHYRAYIVPKLRDRSFRSVAHEYQVGTGTLINATTALMGEHDITWPQTPFTLGLDGHSFRGRDLMMTVTDVRHRKLLTLLPDDHMASLRVFLTNMPEVAKKLITSVTIDMHAGYRAVIAEVLLDTPVVIDRFHVIAHLNQQLSELRLVFTSRKDPLPKQLFEKNKEVLTQAERALLKEIFRRYPAIAELWRIKEIMRRIYRYRDPQEARRHYESLLEGLVGDTRPRFAGIYRTLKRWKNDILNYHTHRITNGYTEGVHTRIKLLKRVSYGFRNKTNYIAKMTLAFLPFAALLTMIKTSPSLT